MFKFREIWLTGNRWNRTLFTWQKKQNFARLSNCRYCSDHAQNLPGPASNNVLRVLQGIGRKKKTTCMFRPFQQVAVTEAKSTVSDCILFGKWMRLLILPRQKINTTLVRCTCYGTVRVCPSVISRSSVETAERIQLVYDTHRRENTGIPKTLSKTLNLSDFLLLRHGVPIVASVFSLVRLMTVAGSSHWVSIFVYNTIRWARWSASRRFVCDS